MAKINGFELKGVKFFHGHEGEDCTQGNIYLNGKKVGWYSDSYTMGPMDIHFDDPETEKLFGKTAELYISSYPGLFDGSGFLNPDVTAWFDTEMLINELLTINEWEKLAKKAFRDGYLFCTMQIDISSPEKYYIGQQRTSMTISRVDPTNIKPKDDIKRLRIIKDITDFNIIVKG